MFKAATNGSLQQKLLRPLDLKLLATIIWVVLMSRKLDKNYSKGQILEQSVRMPLANPEQFKTCGTLIGGYRDQNIQNRRQKNRRTAYL